MPTPIRHTTHPIIVSLLVLCCLSGAHAEMYKWIDDNGDVHFGDRAPSEKKVQAIDEQLKPVNISKSSTNTTKPAASNKEEKTQDEKNLAAKNKKELEKKIGQACRNRKADIQAIASGARGRFFNSDGTEEIVLEKDRGKKLEEWKADYTQSACQSLYPLEDP